MDDAPVDIGADAVSPVGAAAVDSVAAPLEAAATAADGSDGSDAGASGGVAGLAALVGSTTAVAAGESGVCLSQADNDAATASAMTAERKTMDPLR